MHTKLLQAFITQVQCLLEEIENHGRTVEGTCDISIKLCERIPVDNLNDEVKYTTYNCELLEKEDGSWVVEEVTIS